jgi:hypothetical protein
MATKAQKEHYALTQLFKEQWENPPAGFNSQYDAVKAEKYNRTEKLIKKELDAYHLTLKGVPNDEYYDLMDAREKELRKKYKSA